jgi:hypothetical protein
MDRGPPGGVASAGTREQMREQQAREASSPRRTAVLPGELVGRHGAADSGESGPGHTPTKTESSRLAFAAASAPEKLNAANTATAEHPGSFQPV